VLFTDKGTISLWYTHQGRGSQSYMTLARGSGTDVGIEWTLSSNTLYMYVYDTGSASYKSASITFNPVIGHTYHIVGTWDVSTAQANIYVDTVAGTPYTTAWTPGANPTTMYVGCYTGTTRQVNGLIDDLAILHRAIPASEVRAIYESNAPVFAETS